MSDIPDIPEPRREEMAHRVTVYRYDARGEKITDPLARVERTLYRYRWDEATRTCVLDSVEEHAEESTADGEDAL